MALTRAEVASSKKYYSLPLDLDCIQHSRVILEKSLTSLDWTEREVLGYDILTNNFPL